MESVESVCFKAENKKAEQLVKGPKMLKKKKNAKKLKEKFDFC